MRAPARQLSQTFRGVAARRDGPVTPRAPPAPSAGEAPADAADAVHDRLGAGVLELLTQAVRSGVDCFAAGSGGGWIVAPDVAGELVAAEGLVRLSGERLQEVELQAGELERVVVDAPAVRASRSIVSRPTRTTRRRCSLRVRRARASRAAATTRGELVPESAMSAPAW